ncbi:MAG: cation:proton antiporter [Lachnospiraceae bacterium]|nr:cation:proton antiporter [Lachnospiraceae bacterium]
MVHILTISIALLAGLLMTRLFKILKLNLPDVTAFLIAGLIIGPYCMGRIGIDGLGFTSMEAVDSVVAVSNAALGFIAFTIGNEFRLSKLKNTGRQAVITGIAEACLAVVFTDAAMLGLHFILGEERLPLSAAITLGAIASATAPAATLMVVRQYKAKGPLTSLLLQIVALDDAIGLILFAVSFGIATALEGGALTAFSMIINPILQIVFSLVLGAVLGALLTQLEKLFYSNSNRLSLTIGFVLLTVALSSVKFSIGPVTVSFSSLLVCMMLGMTFCNMSEYSEDIMSRADRWTAPLFAIFFVISGAGLELKVLTLPHVLLIGAVYIVIRCVGKYTGARLGSKATGCSPTVQKHLGITLFPQAGVALGMVVTARSLGGSKAELIRNIILFGVLIYELFGPMLTRNSLKKAGEIADKSGDKDHRQRFKTA